MTKLFVPIITAFVWLFLLNSNVHAAILQTHIDRSYTVFDDYMEVVEVKTTAVTRPGFKIPAGQEEVFILQNFIKTDPELEQQKLQYMRDSLQLINEAGEVVDPDISTDDGSLVVKATFPKDVRYGERYTFTIKYRSMDLVQKSGNLHDIYVIPFADEFEFHNSEDEQIYSTKITIPIEFGDINFSVSGDEPIKQNGNWIINIPTKDLIGKFGWIQTGTTQYYKFILRQPYEPSNPTPLFLNKFAITLPRNITTSGIDQKVFFESFSPEPDSIHLDTDNNVIATFLLPASQGGEITITGYAQIDQNKRDLLASGDIEDIPAEFSDLTAASQYWEVTHPDIIAKAEQLKGDEDNVYKLVERTYLDIVNSIDYDTVDRFGISERKGALSTLHGGGAVCMEYSDLFITLMRAMGIPARAAYGHGYDSRTPLEEQVGHQWAEVYFPKLEQWVSIDVTWGESGQTLIGGDLNHLYTHVTSHNPEDPPQVRTTFYGNDPTTEVVNLNVNAREQIPISNKLIGPDELLNTYPQTQPDYIGKLISLLDDGLDSWLLEAYGLDSSSSRTVKVLIVLLMTAILGAISYRLIRFRKRNNDFIQT